MPYRNDFYIRENIIGYTGNLHNNPTVYFSNKLGKNLETISIDGVDENLIVFGHITQEHDEADNIGRMKLRQSYSYQIINSKNEDNEVVAFEVIYGQRELRKIGIISTEDIPDRRIPFHECRSRFRKMYQSNIELLVPAINRFPNMKLREYKYNYKINHVVIDFS